MQSRVKLLQLLIMYIVKTFGNMYGSLNKLFVDQRAIFMGDSSDQRATSIYIYIYHNG